MTITSQIANSSRYKLSSSCSTDLSSPQKSVKKIEVATDVDAKEWDELAKQFDGSFFHCHDYAMFEAASSNGQPLFVKAFNYREECVGIALGSILAPRLWPFCTNCRVASFATLPAMILPDSESHMQVMQILEEYLKRMGVYLIEISSCESPRANHLLSGLSYMTGDRFEYYLDLGKPIDDVWKHLKGSRRTDVRKAEGLGVKTLVENTEFGLQLLEGLYYESMERRGVQHGHMNGATRESYLGLFNTGKATLLVSYLGSRPLNAAIFFNFNGKAYYHLSGSSLTGNKSCGPVHLLWTAIKLHKEHGCSSFNLGAVSGEEINQHSLASFKQGFGSERILQPRGSKIIGKYGAALHKVLMAVKSFV